MTSHEGRQSNIAQDSDFLEWDVRNWSAALEFWLKHTTHRLSGCTALEIGSRNGGLSLWLALQGASVVCTDVNGPTELAKSLHKSNGVSHLIEYRDFDATNSPYHEQFDIIVFKSVLGGIGSRGGVDSQQKAISAIHKALKKGGELFFAENLAASPVHKFLRRKFVRWGTNWRYVSISEMKEFLKPFSTVQLSEFGFTGAFGRTETQRNWLGMLDRIILDRLVPDNWNYIMAGVAKK